MKQSLQIYYNNIIVEGKIELNKNESYLIAATHPNSFLDAIILAAVLQQPLYFLARSDVFNKKWSNFILRKLNLIPIYRLQEGHENLSKNDKTFDECYHILEKQGSILIFAEGISLIDKKVRPLKKGLTRIGFGAELRNQFTLNTHVVPIGINYQKAKQFGNNVLVSIQDKIPLKSFKKAYQENANQAYTQFNQVLLDSLKQASIETDEEAIYDAIVEQINPKKYKLTFLKQIAKQIEFYKTQNQEKWKELKEAIKSLQRIQEKYGFKPVNNSFNAFELILVLIISPLAFLGFSLNKFPFLLANFISNKKVRLIEFHDSVKLVLGTLLWILWAATLSIYLGIIIHPLLYLSSFALLILGKIYLVFKNKIAKIISSLRYKKMNKSADNTTYQKAKKLIESLAFNTI